MWKKCGLGSLFVVVCLAVMGTGDALSQNGQEKKEDKSVDQKKIMDKEVSFPPNPGADRGVNVPANAMAIPDILSRLRRIKQMRAELDKEENDLMEAFKTQINAEKQSIQAQEQELMKIVSQQRDKSLNAPPSPPIAAEKQNLQAQEQELLKAVTQEREKLIKEQRIDPQDRLPGQGVTLPPGNVPAGIPPGALPGPGR